MRKPYSEFEFGVVRLALWAGAILAIVLIVGLTWGCGPSDPSTGKLEVVVEDGVITWEDGTEVEQPPIEVEDTDLLYVAPDEKEPDDG